MMNIMTTFIAIAAVALVCSISGAKDTNQLEKEFWDAWGDTGKAKWGDLLQWTKEYRFHYCAEFHKEIYGETIPELLYIPSSFPLTISLSFHSEISKKLGLYRRQIYNVETIHCNFINLIYKNSEEKIKNEIDYLITKKKDRNCLLQIYQECLTHKNFKREGPEYFKIPTDRYYLADEICWEKDPLSKTQDLDQVEGSGHYLHKISERFSKEIESEKEVVDYPLSSDKHVLRVGQVVVKDCEKTEKKKELDVVAEEEVKEMENEKLEQETSSARTGPATWSEVEWRVQRAMADERDNEQREMEKREKKDHLLDRQSDKLAHLSWSELERRVKRMMIEVRGEEARLHDPQSTQLGYFRLDDVMKQKSGLGREEKQDALQDPQFATSEKSSCSEVIRQFKKIADEEEVDDYSRDPQSARTGNINCDEGVRQLIEVAVENGEEYDTQDAQKKDKEQEDLKVDKDNKNVDEANDEEEDGKTRDKHSDEGVLGMDENITARDEVREETKEEEKEEQNKVITSNSHEEYRVYDSDNKEDAEETKIQLKEFMAKEIEGKTEERDGKKNYENLDHSRGEINTAYGSSSSDIEYKLSQEILHEEADEILGLSEEDTTTDESIASHIMNMTEEEICTDESIRNTASPIRNVYYDENLYITETTLSNLLPDWDLESHADKIACWSSDDESYYLPNEFEEEKYDHYYNNNVNNP